jgi:hypothetical protein
MNPAFFAPQMRTYFSLFQSSAYKVELFTLSNGTKLTPNDPIARSKMEGGSNRPRHFPTTIDKRGGMAFPYYARYHRRR